MRLHDEPPPVEAKPLLTILDEEPVLSPQLMELGQWIAQYYLAPIGEVVRSMLPLMSEVRRQVLYRITAMGRQALAAGAERGSSRRSRLSPAEQDQEYAVLNALESGEAVRAARLRSTTGASLRLLQGMLRKKWIARETAAESRDARRTVRYAVLVDDVRLPKLNDNQQAILAELAAAAGELPCRGTASSRNSGVNPCHAGETRAGSHRRTPRGFPPHPSARFRDSGPRAERRAERGPEDDHRSGGGKRVSPVAVAGGHRIGQDRGVSRGNAPHPGRRPHRDSAGSGNRPDAGDGGATPPCFWIGSCAAPLRAYAGRARRAVASHPQGRSARCGRYAFGNFCAC